MANAKMRNSETTSKLPLTARQREALEFIRKCVRKRGYGPTVREIGDHMGINSPNGVVGHLIALQRKGFIQREANLSRSIMLVERGEKPVSGIPVSASIRNGCLITNLNPEIWTNIHEKIHIDGDDFFLIRVEDDSLFAKHFFRPGDLLLMRRSRNAASGETAIIRGLEDEFDLANCVLDPQTDTLRLVSDFRWYDNSCSGIFGILISVMRFKFGK